MSELTTKQCKTIAALLTEPTTEAAASTAGVNSRTIRRWLTESNSFRRALTEAEAQAVAEAARSIAAGSREAITHLRGVLNDPEADPERKDRAANNLLSHTPKLRLLGSIEISIEELTRNAK